MNLVDIRSRLSSNFLKDQGVRYFPKAKNIFDKLCNFKDVDFKNLLENIEYIMDNLGDQKHPSQNTKFAEKCKHLFEKIKLFKSTKSTEDKNNCLLKIHELENKSKLFQNFSFGEVVTDAYYEQMADNSDIKKVGLKERADVALKAEDRSNFIAQNNKLKLMGGLRDEMLKNVSDKILNLLKFKPQNLSEFKEFSNLAKSTYDNLVDLLLQNVKCNKVLQRLEAIDSKIANPVFNEIEVLDDPLFYYIDLLRPLAVMKDGLSDKNIDEYKKFYNEFIKTTITFKGFIFNGVFSNALNANTIREYVNKIGAFISEFNKSNPDRKLKHLGKNESSLGEFEFNFQNLKLESEKASKEGVDIELNSELSRDKVQVLCVNLLDCLIDVINFKKDSYDANLKRLIYLKKNLHDMYELDTDSNQDILNIFQPFFENLGKMLEGSNDLLKEDYLENTLTIARLKNFYKLIQDFQKIIKSIEATTGHAYFVEMKYSLLKLEHFISSEIDKRRKGEVKKFSKSEEHLLDVGEISEIIPYLQGKMSYVYDKVEFESLDESLQSFKHQTREGWFTKPTEDTKKSTKRKTKEHEEDIADEVWEMTEDLVKEERERPTPAQRRNALGNVSVKGQEFNLESFKHQTREGWFTKPTEDTKKSTKRKTKEHEEDIADEVWEMTEDLVKEERERPTPAQRRNALGNVGGLKKMTPVALQDNIDVLSSHSFLKDKKKKKKIDETREKVIEKALIDDSKPSESDFEYNRQNKSEDVELEEGKLDEVTYTVVEAFNQENNLNDEGFRGFNNGDMHLIDVDGSESDDSVDLKCKDKLRANVEDVNQKSKQAQSPPSMGHGLTHCSIEEDHQKRDLNLGTENKAKHKKTLVEKVRSILPKRKNRITQFDPDEVREGNRTSLEFKPKNKPEKRFGKFSRLFSSKKKTLPYGGSMLIFN